MNLMPQKMQNQPTFSLFLSKDQILVLKKFLITAKSIMYSSDVMFRVALAP